MRRMPVVSSDAQTANVASLPASMPLVFSWCGQGVPDRAWIGSSIERSSCTTCFVGCGDAFQLVPVIVSRQSEHDV